MGPGEINESQQRAVHNACVAAAILSPVDGCLCSWPFTLLGSCHGASVFASTTVGTDYGSFAHPISSMVVSTDEACMRNKKALYV